MGSAASAKIHVEHDFEVPGITYTKSKMSNIAIVAITFNRPKSLERLLRSLLIANYPPEQIDLIISIDYSGCSSVKEIAVNTPWPHGAKKIIEHPINLGLREHVLLCGDLSEQYENICVFEDDTFASPGFFLFARQAIEAYGMDDRMAGISLYSNHWNQYVNKPFIPLDDGTDVYFMQVAASWGQIWSRGSWRSFRAWMLRKADKDLYINGLPVDVANWSSKSWLKFHNAYLVEENKYFVYPRISLSTNFSDAGEHASENTIYQVPLLAKAKDNYNLINFDKGIRYDAYYESQNLTEISGIRQEEIDVSFYTNKPEMKRYRLTLERRNEKIVKSWGLRLRPIELNIINNIEGAEIKLYDTCGHCLREKYSIENSLNIFLYYFQLSDKRELLRASLRLYWKALKRRLLRTMVKRRKSDPQR